MVKIARIDPLRVLKRMLKRGGEIKVNDLLAQLSPDKVPTNLGSVRCPHCHGNKVRPHRHCHECSDDQMTACGDDNSSYVCGKKEGTLEPCARCKKTGRIPIGDLILKPG